MSLLYLLPTSQHNRLTVIDGVASLPRLKFLAVSHNRIREVRVWGGEE